MHGPLVVDTCRHARRGVTMLEIAVTLMVAGVFASIAVVKFDAGKYKADAAATYVQTSLQQAERLAVQRQYNVIVSVDLANARLRLIEDANEDGRASVGERVTWRPLGDGMRFDVPPATVGGAPAAAVVGSHIKLLDGMPTITMRRDGAATSDLELYVKSPRNRATDFRAVVMTQSTGRADVLKWTGSSWMGGLY